MKNLMILLLLAINSLALIAQSPGLIHYQGIVRDINGDPLNMSPIQVQIKISTDLAGNNIVFEETHQSSTNQFGLFNLKIGEASPPNAISGLDWATNEHYLNVSVDVGNGMDDLGTFQFITVPYALHSSTSSTALDDNDRDNQNEIQGLSLNGTELSITNNGGNANINLPILWSLNGTTAEYLGGNANVDGSITAGFDLIAGDDITVGDDIFTDRVNIGSSGTVTASGPNGNTNFFLSTLSGNNNHGWLGIYNADGQDRVRATVLGDGTGFFRTFGPNGNSNFTVSNLSGNNNHGWMGLHDANGEDRFRSGVSSGGAGFTTTFGANGNLNFRVTNLSGNSNHGYALVADANGDQQAGMFVDANGDGIVFGDQKNFRMDHPDQAGKEIWYASLEGPEVAAYERGKASLEDGKATVYFSDHFQVVANPATFTFNLTPFSAASKGLAVVEVTGTYFKVQELLEGVGNYTFSWEVKGVRKGKEDFSVVRDKIDLKPPKSDMGSANSKANQAADTKD